MPSSGGQPCALMNQPRDVGRAAEEGRMAERQQAGEAQQQVERAGEQGEAQQLHHEHRDTGRSADASMSSSARIGECQVARSQCGGSFSCGLHALQASLPNRPAGRSISTITMITKTTTLEASG